MTKKLAIQVGAAALKFAPSDVLKILIPTIAIFAASVLLASAHHSTVMFEPDKEVTLTGTVKEFQYTNPHSFVQIIVPGAGGRLIEWRIETVSPLALKDAGIGPAALRPGDKVTVRAHPLKEGGPGARLIDVKKADGTVLSAPGG